MKSTKVYLAVFSLLFIVTQCSKSSSDSGGAASAGGSKGFRVIYDGNGNTGGAAPTDSGEYASGASATILTNSGALTKTGLSFLGWNSQADGLGTYYATGATLTVTANTTLYALWLTDRQWGRALAMSADGTKIVAASTNTSASNTFNSTDSGLSWTQRTLAGGGPRYWATASSDGTKFVLVGGGAYLSTDSGAIWNALTGAPGFTVACSSTCANIAGGSFPGQLATSTDTGANWTARETSRNWNGIASSADGVKLVAVVNAGQIYTSTDSGVNWTARDSSRNWNAVASSSDGVKLVAVVGNGQIYTSTDSGANWTARDSSRNWQSVASSSDGTKLAATVYNGQIYTSIDSGATWTARDTNRVWIGVASSADGSKLAAAVQGGQVYVSHDSGATWVPRL